MATFLDLGLLEGFQVVFTFIFIYVLLYAALQKTKPFGDITGGGPAGIHAILSLAIAIVSVSVPAIREIVNFMVPWFFVVFVVGFLMVFIAMALGAKEGDIHKLMTKDKQVSIWIVVFAIIIIIFGLGRAFGSDSLAAGNWNTSPTSGEGTMAPSDPADQWIDETGVGNSGADGSNVATNDFGTNVVNTIFNPKVLGMIFILLIATFAVLFLART